MDIREFFFWIASIFLALVSLFIIALFVFMLYLKRLADRASEQFTQVGRVWRNLTITRFVIRLAKLIF